MIDKLTTDMFRRYFDRKAVVAPEGVGERLSDMGYIPHVIGKSIFNPFGAAALAIVPEESIILVERPNIEPEPGSTVFAVGKIGLFGVAETRVFDSIV